MKRVRAFLSGGPFPVRRLGRKVLWQSPRLYRWVGILRDRGDCLLNDYEVWFGGYPRSANTFSVAAFKLANPTVRVASHWHIPAFIINALQDKKPGMFLVRQPKDSVVSWTIFWQGKLKLGDSLDYYLDFHRAMLSHRENLFVSPFEQTINNFEGVLSAFNTRFGTNYAAPVPGKKTSEECLKTIEDWLRAPDGSINEFVVSRPSPKRVKIKAQLSEMLRKSPSLSRKLEMAQNLYAEFSAGHSPKASAPTRDLLATDLSQNPG